MRYKLRLFVIVCGLIGLLATGVVQAALESINIWTLSPDPAAINEELTTNISFSSDTGGSATHQFCIEGPSNAGDSDANWYGTMPVTITLQATQGFDSEVVDFVKDSLPNSDSTCPGGSRVALYSGTISNTVDIDVNSAIDFNTSVGAIIDLDAAGNLPSAGTENWTLYLGSAAGIPGSLTYGLELTEPSGTRYISDTAGCGGNTPCNSTADTMLQDAIDALPTSGGTVIVYNTATITQTFVGAKNILIQGFDSSAILENNGATTCTLVDGVATPMLAVNGSGNLTVEGVLLDHPTASIVGCTTAAAVESSGALTIQSSTVISGWVNGLFGSTSASSTIVVDNSSFVGNSDTAINVSAGSGSLAVNDSTFSTNNNGVSTAVDATVVDSSFTDGTSVAIGFSASATGSVVGNEMTDNSGFGVSNGGSGAVVAYANNFSGNSGGGFQASLGSADNFAKNWWGSPSSSSVGPGGDAAVSMAAWNARLGSDVESYAAGTGTVTLGGASLSGGSGTGAIIDLGASSSEAPFGVGLAPFVNLACSPFYDFYGVDTPTGWTVGLPISVGMSGCTSEVFSNEIAYVINDISECAAPGDSGCWDPISTDDIVASGGDTLLITNLSLSGTHIVAGESSQAADPTAVTLSAINVSTGLDATVMIILSIVLALGTALFVFGKMKTAVS